MGVAVFGAIVNSYVSSHSGSSDPNIEHLSIEVLEPAINDVFLATVFITLALLVVGFLMPTRVIEPDAPTSAEPAAEPAAESAAESAVEAPVETVAEPGSAT
jgi:hypothetical protein